MRLVCIGEILWDVFRDGERIGGAPFNLAAHAARLGHESYLLSAVGDDERGRRAVHLARQFSVRIDFLHTTTEAPTGHVTVSLDSSGLPTFTIHRPAAYDYFRLQAEQLQRLSELRPDYVAFGTLHQTAPVVKAHTQMVLDACPSARRFYDVNLRRDCYNPFLVEELMLLADITKLNREEMDEINRLFGVDRPDLRRSCEYWLARCGWSLVAVTLGPEGCVLYDGNEYVESPGYPVVVADTVGAGDAFSAALLHGLSQNWPLDRVADFANRAAALVASRPGAVPEWTAAEAMSLERR